MKSNSSEPTIYGMKGNKPFVAAKRSSAARPTNSYKLSSRMKAILSNDLKSASAHARIGDDSTLQSTNTRRRFQRRGSKSPSMFQAISMGQFDIPDSLFQTIRQEPISTGNSNVVLESAAGIQKGSERSYLSTLTDFSDNMDTENDSDEFAC